MCRCCTLCMFLIRSLTVIMLVAVLGLLCKSAFDVAATSISIFSYETIIVFYVVSNLIEEPPLCMETCRYH